MAREPKWRRSSLAVVIVAGLLGPEVRAENPLGVPASGHGSVTLSASQVLVTQRTDDRGRHENLGEVTYHTLRLDLDYAITDRWAVSAGLPYGHNRYAGDDPHDPRIFADPHGQRFIDDGDFHGGWKDWFVGTRYLLRDGPLLVTPYLNLHTPSHDYQYYGEAALGLHRWELQAGVNVGGRLPPPWQNVFVGGGYSYNRVQRRGDWRVDYSLVNLQLGCFFSPRFSGRLELVHRRSHGGFDFPGDLFDAQGHLIEERLFRHDTNRRIEYNELRAGLGWQLNDRYALSVEGVRTLHGDNANLIKSGVNLGLERSF